MEKNPKNLKLASRRTFSTEEQEKALQQLQNASTEKTTPTPPLPEIEERDVVRISIDIPRPLYEKVKKESKLRGYSMRAFFVQRGWEYFESEK
jgi:hypothetical protein